MTDKDQSIKRDAGKYKPSLVPPRIIEAIARVREYELVNSEGEESWYEVEPRRWVDALGRHYWAYLSGEETDEESGLPHSWHMATNLAFLIEIEPMAYLEDLPDYEEMETEDNRPPRHVVDGLIDPRDWEQG